MTQAEYEAARKQEVWNVTLLDMRRLEIESVETPQHRIVRESHFVCNVVRRMAILSEY